MHVRVFACQCACVGVWVCGCVWVRASSGQPAAEGHWVPGSRPGEDKRAQREPSLSHARGVGGGCWETQLSLLMILDAFAWRGASGILKFGRRRKNKSGARRATRRGEAV